MDSRPSQKGMIAAIVFASAVLSASLVFSSLAFTGQLSANVIGRPATTEVAQSDIEQKIQAGIDDYAKRKAAEGSAVQPTVATNAAKTNAAADSVRRVDPAKDHVYGDAKARISLIEYSDYKCPYCRTFHPTAKKLVDNFSGKVNWSYRHYPLPSHDPAATMLAVASECVTAEGGNDAFWKFSEAIFSPTATPSGGDDAVWASELAAKLGYNKTKVLNCIKENKFLSTVQESYSEGGSFGVNGTPGNFLVDNKTGKVQFIPGALSYERLKTLVDNMLAQ